ncbi:hypothetical protein KAJ61_02045 [Candidatus Parcubacteria bacterium]|nr:hypothetical protein [Candidatus Parcubacteria bacterium]
MRLNTKQRNKHSAKLLDISETIRPFPKIYIPLMILQKIQCYVDLCTHEVNGIGNVECRGNDFWVSDVIILKQKATERNVEIDPKALNKYVYDLVVQGKDPSTLKFQWHSHVDMPTFFSPEDIDTIAGYMNDFMISFVINKAGDYRCRLDLFKPFHLAIEVPVYVVAPPLQTKLISECQDEIKQKVIFESTVTGVVPVSRQAYESNIDNTGETIIRMENFPKEDATEFK